MPVMIKPLKIAGFLFVTLSFAANICFATQDTIHIRKSILRIAIKISKYKTVDDRAVGFAGLMTDQYNRFYSLMQLATDNELITLTDHKNEKVRAYAFWALAKRNFSDIKIILEKHLCDTTSFDFYAGCLQTPQRVNYFFLDILTPNHVDELCFKLTENEIKSYYKRIAEAIEQKKK